MSFVVDPTQPANSSAVSGGASAIRNVSSWLLQIFGFGGTAAQTFANNPFAIDANNLVTVQSNPISELGIATKGYVDAATAPNCGLVFSSGSQWTGTLTPAIASYIVRAQYTVQWPSASVGNDTINLNGLGALTVKKNYNGTLINLSANDIPASSTTDLIYDGTNLQIVMGPVPMSGSSGGAAGGYASVSITSGSVSHSGYSPLIGTLALTAPASGGPFRLVVSYFVVLTNSNAGPPTTFYTVDMRVTDGTNYWGYGSGIAISSGSATDGTGLSVTDVSPVTYANGATPSITVQAASNGSTVTAGGNSLVTTSPSYIKGWFVPSS